MARVLRRDSEAVASTVATIFALLVVLLFLSAIIAAEATHQKDREWLLFQEAQEDFRVIGQTHDLQFLAWMVPRVVPRLVAPASVVVPVDAGMPAASPFLPPVDGVMRCDPTQTVAQVSFSFRAGSAAIDAVEPSMGVLVLDLATHQLPHPRIVWENGAVLAVQSDGSLIREYPYFSVQVIPGGYAVTYRAVRLIADRWSTATAGPQLVSVRTLAAESIWLNVTGRGDANLDDVRAFVGDLKGEIRRVSTDGSGRLTGSYADMPPSEGILNQGLTEQLVYYINAQAKQQIPDCAGASNDMNASARQLLLNVMNKILEGIDTGYIDSAYGLDLHTRLSSLLRCLDEMSTSLQSSCEFRCRSLFGGSGGNLEFLLPSEHREAWRRWFTSYFVDRGVSNDDWAVEVQGTFVLVRIEGVRQLLFEAAYVDVR